MTRFGMILFCALAAPAAAAAAENLIEPGQWKVTSNTVVNGANYGLLTTVSAMRTMDAVIRLRF